MNNKSRWTPPMKKTAAVILGFILGPLLFILGGWEAWALFFDGGTPNNTISHVVETWFVESPWLKYGVTAIFVLLMGHWCRIKWWPWNPPEWDNDPKTPEDESLRNLKMMSTPNLLTLSGAEKQKIELHNSTGDCVANLNPQNLYINNKEGFEWTFLPNQSVGELSMKDGRLHFTGDSEASAKMLTRHALPYDGDGSAVHLREALEGFLIEYFEKYRHPEAKSKEGEVTL